MGELASYGRLAETVFVIPTSESIFLGWLKTRAAREAGLGIVPNLKHYHHSHLDPQPTDGVAGSRELMIRRDTWEKRSWRRLPLVCINTIPLVTSQEGARCEVWVARLHLLVLIDEKPAEFRLWDAANGEYDRLIADIETRWPGTVVSQTDGRAFEWRAWEGQLPGKPPKGLVEEADAAMPGPEGPVGARKRSTPGTVFVSYSHADKAWLKRLRVHLKPLERKGIVDFWADTIIQPGAHWREEVAVAVNAATVALLLISADFLASDFIMENELPPLLEAARIRGAQIVPIIVSPCRFEDTPALSRFQAVNASSRPLTAMSHDEQERTFLEVSRVIERILTGEG
jgi:hypothetical protein